MRYLTGTIQPYAWGSTTVIPDLLGVEPTGKPQAELWLGAHPLHPSTVDGTPLTKLIAAEPGRLAEAGGVVRPRTDRGVVRLPGAERDLRALRPAGGDVGTRAGRAVAGWHGHAP